MVIAHIESERAMKNVDALLAVGIDVYHLGREGVRTAQAFQHKARISASSRSWRRQSAELQRGRTAGCTATIDAPGTRRLIELGARYLTCRATRFMASAARPLSNIRGEHA
jgi:hypothetical protein